MSIWILIGFAAVFVAFFSVRGVLLGKREARRLDALFAHVASYQCPACGVVYGADVKQGIELTFDHEDVLPDALAKHRRVSTWRIPCPRCGVVALLAEDYPGVCEFLKARA